MSTIGGKKDRKRFGTRANAVSQNRRKKNGGIKKSRYAMKRAKA